MRPVSNPPNPYESAYREWLEAPPPTRLEVYTETARSILSENESPDLPFRWSVNPYRGCQHACAYCYARPYHEYLGYGAGTDFDTKLVVKVNAAELLAEAFERPKWDRESVNFSGVTDCYQPLESVWEITRRCLEVCVRFRNPVGIVTKGYLIRRDAELLAQLNAVAGARVYMSIAFADDKMARAIEPQAPPPSRRFEAISILRDAGVPVSVMVAPIIPGLNDREIGEVLRMAAEAGAKSAGFTILRLPTSVETVFLSRLREALPDRAKRVENRIRDVRGGQLNDSRFGHRMKGEGVYYDSIKQLFSVTAERYGLRRSSTPLAPKTKEAKPSSADSQLTFGFE